MQMLYQVGRKQILHDLQIYAHYKTSQLSMHVRSFIIKKNNCLLPYTVFGGKRCKNLVENWKKPLIPHGEFIEEPTDKIF